MKPLRKNQLLELHRQGVPLRSAWLTYAHPTLKSQWAELRDQSGLEVIERDAKAASESDGDTIGKIVQAFSGYSALSSKRAKLQSTLKANIQTFIAQGQLFGFGYELPRSVSSIPVAIPKDAWSGRCDWDQNTLSYQGLEFVDVRLTTNRIKKKIMERGSVDMTDPDPIGRPSISQDIVDAFNALAAAGQIDITQSQKAQFPKVQRWLELNRPDLHIPPKNISYETVRRNIAPLFRELKKNTKQ